MPLMPMIQMHRWQIIMQAIDMAMLPVDTITNELPKKFRRWIESLKVDSSVKPLSGLVKPGAKYLDFNYTEFAETLYGAKGVCYIHGSRKTAKPN